jgi:hypothetical protein
LERSDDEFQLRRASGPLPRPRPQGRAVRYWRFNTAAKAIRFAVEELPAPLLVRAYLQVEDERFDSDEYANSIKAQRTRSNG